MRTSSGSRRRWESERGVIQSHAAVSCRSKHLPREPRWRKLNGWHRLWIVWCVLAAPIALVLIINIADSTKSEMDRVSEEKTQAEDGARNAAKIRLGAARTSTGDAQRDELIAKIDDTIGDDQMQSDLKAINHQYSVRLAEAHSRDVRHFWTAVGALWLLMAGCVYAAGAAFVWARNGFRRPREDQAQTGKTQ